MLHRAPVIPEFQADEAETKSPLRESAVLPLKRTCPKALNLVSVPRAVESWDAIQQDSDEKELNSKRDPRAIT